MTSVSLGENTKSEVIRRSARLREPINYWKGKPEREPLRPENILLFQRRVGTQLMEQSKGEHHRFLLIANLKGDGKVAVDRQVVPLREGESLLIFPSSPIVIWSLHPPGFHWTFATFEHEPDPRLEVLRHRGGVPLGDEGFSHLRNTLRAWQSDSGLDVLPFAARPLAAPSGRSGGRETTERSETISVLPF